MAKKGKLEAKAAVKTPVAGRLYYVKDGSVYSVKAKTGGKKGRKVCKPAAKKRK